MPELLYDEFKIGKKQLLNNEDINSLSKLYLSLVGIDSYSLYFVLNTLDKDVTYNYRYLIDCVNFKTLKSLNNALDKLAGIGLLRVFKNNNNNYLYVLNRPKTINEFFREEVLVTLLESQIGSDELNKLRDLCDKNIKEYKEVTKKFDEVFDIQVHDTYDVVKDLYLDTNDFKIVNKNFNYSYFKLQFDSSFISEDILDDLTFKENINRISFVYQLNEEQMKDVVFSSFDLSHDLDYASLSKSAKKIYRDVHKNDSPKITSINRDEYLGSIKDDQTLALCDHLEAVSPSEMLEELSHIKPSLAEITMFADLGKNTGFSNGLINLMIVITHHEKNGELPGYSYFEKIANTWARAKVKTIPDALNYIEKHQKKVKDSKGKEVKLPAWYDEYNKELQKKLDENENIQNEEAQKILETAKDLFGGK